MDLRQCRQTVSVILIFHTHPVAALVPAVSQQQLHTVFPGFQTQLIGLVLDPAVIIAESRKEAFLPLLLPVDIELIEA